MSVAPPETPQSPEADTASQGISGEDVADLARLVLLVFVIIVLVQMTSRLGQVLGQLALATALAYLSAPLRRSIARRVGEGLAALAVVVITFAGLTGVAFSVTRDLAAQSNRLRDALVGRIDLLRPGSLPARLADAVDAKEAIATALGRVSTSVVVGESSAVGVGAQVADLLVVVVLAVFVQSSGRALITWLIARWPRNRRADLHARVLDVDRRAGRYARRSLLISALIGLCAGGLCAVVGLPGGVVLGAWAGLWAPVPLVGSVVGLVPLLVSGLVYGYGDVRLVVMLCGVGVIGVASTWARRRLALACSMTPGPVLWTVAAATGQSIGGARGVIVCATLLAIASAVLTGPLKSRGSGVAAAATVVATGVTSDKIEADVSGAHASATNSTSNSSSNAQRLAVGAQRLFRRRDDDEWWRSVLNPRGLLVVAMTATCATVAWMLLRQLSVVAAWLVVGALLALAFDRPVGFVETRVRRVSRPGASIIVLATGVMVAAAVAAFAVRGGSDTVPKLGDQFVLAVEEMERFPLIGERLRTVDASDWVRDQLAGLPDRVDDGRGAASWLPRIGTGLVDLFWIAVLAVVMLVDGPRLSAALRRRLPVRSRRQYQRLIEVSHEAFGGYLGGAATVAAINGILVLVTGVSLGIGLAPAVAAWAFLCNFVPQIGGFIGGVPLVVLALAEGPVAALVALTVFFTYQMIENNVIQPKVISKAIDVPPITAMLAALIGAAAGGLIGAVLLTPIVGVVKVVHDTYRSDSFPGRVAPSR